MPFILAGIAIVAAAVYYAFQLYRLVGTHFGTLAGIGAVAACVAVVMGAAFDTLRRYRAVHGVKIAGERILALRGPWGSLNLDAEHKRGTVELDGQGSAFIFADIEAPSLAEADGGWILTFKLRHNARAVWPLRCSSGREARRWARILTLAIHQKL
jgi:hypothetical protein